LTADTRLTGDVEKVFLYLEEAAKLRTIPQPSFKHLWVSPFNTRKALMKQINRERDKGKDGYCLIKTNHLTDDRIIKKIREAAEAGVKMDLIVRTTYAMLPHENIRAISILDRYLEHQRIYIFGHGDDQRVFMSSADLMERNLDWRVEVAFPVYDPQLRQIITDTMAMQVNDTFKARILDEHQSNQYVGESANGRRAQEETYRYFRDLFAIPDNGHTRARVPNVAPASAESPQE
jgi:polyphosphate kinase